MGKKRRKIGPVVPSVEPDVVESEATRAAGTPEPEAPTSAVTADVGPDTAEVEAASPDAVDPEAAEPGLTAGEVTDSDTEPDAPAADVSAAEPELTRPPATGHAESVPLAAGAARVTAEVTEPVDVAPDAVEPDAVERDAVERDAVEPDAVEPTVGETLEAAAGPTDGTRSESAPDLVRPEVGEPEFTEPDLVGSEDTEPDVVDSETSEPETSEREVVEADAIEPETSEREVVETEVVETEVVQPEASEPEVVEALAMKTELLEPVSGTSAPEEVEAETTDSGPSQSAAVQSETEEPEVTGSATADAGELVTAAPETETPPPPMAQVATEPVATEIGETQPGTSEDALEASPAASGPGDEVDVAPAAADAAKDDERDAEATKAAHATAPSDEPEADPNKEPVEGRAAWRRLLLMGRPRTTKANLLGALLAIALGIGIGTQVQLTNQRGLSELSQTDLVRVLDDISARSSRLDDQIRELETTRDRLKSGTGTTAEALEQAQKRADTLGILAGTIGAQGPGITLRISDPDQQITGPLVLDLIQELRDAGAEAIDVGGVRVVASSFVGESDGTIQIDGTPVDRPFVVKAIGESKTLSSALTIPGGIIETIRQKGARATVNESASLEITSLHPAEDPTQAKPAE